MNATKEDMRMSEEIYNQARENLILGCDWIPGTGDFIKVRSELCTGCAACVKACFGNCFQLKDGKSMIKSYETCCECGACWFVCPENAIDFSWPKGGTGIVMKHG